MLRHSPGVTAVIDNRFPRCSTLIPASAGISRISANPSTRVLRSACTSTSYHRGASGLDFGS